VIRPQYSKLLRREIQDLSKLPFAFPDPVFGAYPLNNLFAELFIHTCQFCGPLDDSLFKFLGGAPLLPQISGFSQADRGLVHCDL